MADNPPAKDPRELIKKFPIAHHHEVPETFADTMGMTSFDGATLRLEFAAARMNETKPPAPPTGERHVVCRLVLSAPCAVDLINQMHLIGAQLAAAGLVKKNPLSTESTTKN